MHYNRLYNIVLTFFVFIKFNFTKCDKLERNSTNYNSYRNQTDEQIRMASVSINLQKELEKLSDEPANGSGSLSTQPHSRKKRLIWITDDGRLALPPGTSLSLSPSISLPFIRHPPEGFTSGLSIGFPVSIDFDKLGLTDDQNPLGDLPPIFARSFGKTAGSMLSSYVADYIHYRRRKRDLNNAQSSGSTASSNEAPLLPEKYKHAFHGGERALLYGVVEDLLENFGVDGKACILRTICEVHSKSLNHFGLIGELTKLFLTASKSPFSDHIKEYVDAEEIGKGNMSPGECFPYYKNCPKSIFKTFANNYSATSQNSNDEISNNMIETDKLSSYNSKNKERKLTKSKWMNENDIGRQQNIASMKK